MKSTTDIYKEMNLSVEDCQKLYDGIINTLEHKTVTAKYNQSYMQDLREYNLSRSLSAVSVALVIAVLWALALSCYTTYLIIMK